MNSGGVSDHIGSGVNAKKCFPPETMLQLITNLWAQLSFLISQRLSAKEERWTINLRLRGMTLVCVASCVHCMVESCFSQDQ